MKILDCTLRDGGYYTNWDFKDSTVELYLKSMNSLPIDYLEIGYVNLGQSGYQGQFFYCSEYTIKLVRKFTTKKLAILIDEKNIEINQVEKVLKPYVDAIDLIRLAVKPENFNKALELAKIIKSMSFEVAFNVMYLSEWNKYDDMFDVIYKMDGIVDYFYMVDSYGSIFPEDLKKTIKRIQSLSKVKLGFHGHNNLEMALINSITALNNGVSIIDATVTGMGRGAGNLKLELLLSVLNKSKAINVNYDALSEVTNEFETLKKQYNWGTSLPYMVSGVRSLPQKDVMEWVSKKYYSLNSVIRALNNKKEDEHNYLKFKPVTKFKKALVVGGGKSVLNHKKAIIELLNREKDICIIHASSKNALPFKDIKRSQFFCLVGNEGLRMVKVFSDLDGFNGVCVLPPSPRSMGTYVPEDAKKQTFELHSINFTNLLNDSHTVIAIQTALELNVDEIHFTGFDGYIEGNIAAKDQELYVENTILFNDLKRINVNFTSITPTNYKTLPQNSVYKILSK